MVETMIHAMRTLQAHEIACRWCGQALPRGGPAVTAATQPEEPFPPREDPRPLVEVGLCDQCAESDSAAMTVVQGLTTEEVAIFGDRGRHRHRSLQQVSRVLHALAIIGDECQPPTWVAADRYLKANAELAARLGWELLYADERRRWNMCATERWSWLDDQDRAAIKRAMDLARSEDQHVALVGSTTPVPSPSGSGCAWCGVSNVEADTREVFLNGSEKAARSAWHFRRALSLWLCPTCWKSRQQNEDKAVRQAILTATGLAEDVKNAKPAVRLRGWVPFRRSGEAASDAPWAHLGGVEHLAEQVRQALVPAENETDLAERVAELESTVRRLLKHLA